jgi:hypothetical protein
MNYRKVTFLELLLTMLFCISKVTAQKGKGQMPSPALIQRYKQCSQKIDQVQAMLNKADKKTLESKF